MGSTKYHHNTHVHVDVTEVSINLQLVEKARGRGEEKLLLEVGVVTFATLSIIILAIVQTMPIITQLQMYS